MPVRDYKQYKDSVDYNYQQVQQEQAPLYQEYLPEAEITPKLSELFFFLNIAMFCVLTVLFSFVFLSVKMNTFAAFALAITASLFTIQGYRMFVKKYRKAKS